MNKHISRYINKQTRNRQTHINKSDHGLNKVPYNFYMSNSRPRERNGRHRPHRYGVSRRTSAPFKDFKNGSFRLITSGSNPTVECMNKHTRVDKHRYTHVHTRACSFHGLREVSNPQSPNIHKEIYGEREGGGRRGTRKRGRKVGEGNEKKHGMKGTKKRRK